MSRSAFSRFVHDAKASGSLAIQPRMGWPSPIRMRAALRAVKNCSPTTVGTLTLDSYTRLGDVRSATEGLQAGESLNGYPLLSHSAATTRAVLEGLFGPNFPVQVRHGTPEPQAIFRRAAEVGLSATEGGPVSYCLPYGRTSLSTSIDAWRTACRIFADEAECGHVESFGGCLMGQLCPPAMLLAVSLLECLFFVQHGIRSVSLSYAQGTSLTQDRAALAVLRDLASCYLAGIDWHVVVYTYMGLFPSTRFGASRLLEDSARLAVASGCERLIVKTVSERRQLPSLTDNLAALRIARTTAERSTAVDMTADELAHGAMLADEVRSIVDAILNLDSDLARALLLGFQRGLVDIPFCLHPDNAGRARACIDEEGWLRWTNRGNVPITNVRTDLDERFSSDALLAQLSYVARKYDTPAPPRRMSGTEEDHGIVAY